jgi:uncharacterized membrane protein YidH (DUF202 family)
MTWVRTAVALRVFGEDGLGLVELRIRLAVRRLRSSLASLDMRGGKRFAPNLES